MSTTTDPPPRHAFIKFAHDQVNPIIIGFDKEPHHLAPALALQGVLNELAGDSHARVASKPITLTAVTKALQAPPHAHSTRAIADLKDLIRRYVGTHGRPLRGASKLQIWEPIAVSIEWLVVGVGSPHWTFRRASPEQRQAAAAAEVERQALAAMSYTAKRRHYSARRHLAITSPNTQEP